LLFTYINTFMKITTLFLSICLLLTVASCKKEQAAADPSACISYADNQTVNQGETITFINCSQNAVSYEWEVVQTGQKSTVDVFTYQANILGPITVKLTAFNKDGKTSVVYKNLTVVDSKLQFIGNYSFSDNCRVTSDVAITATSSGLRISDFFELGDFVTAYNTGSTITIPQQTVDGADGFYTVSGSGTLNQFGNIPISYSYSYTDDNNSANDFSDNCSGTLIAK
jgi:hypothetical protein